MLSPPGTVLKIFCKCYPRRGQCLKFSVSALEKKKYVYRLEDASDRRNKRVYLSEEGALFYGQLRSSLDDIYASAGITVGMEKMKTLLADLKLTRDALEEI